MSVRLANEHRRCRERHARPAGPVGAAGPALVRNQSESAGARLKPVGATDGVAGERPGPLTTPASSGGEP